MNNNSEMIVLIDNSNTRTKLMFSSDGGLGEEVLILPTAEVTAEALLRLVGERSYRGVLVSSVVPALHDEFRRAFGEKTRFLTCNSPLNFDMEYSGGSTLGADRIANVAGAALMGRFPCVAVDMGTAVTFDVLIERQGRPCFIGGAIAPGLSMMAQSLAQKTAQLPVVDYSVMGAVIGKNTVEAMQAGCLRGFVGLVEGMLQAIAAELGCKPFVVATGGDAPLIANYSAFIDKVVPCLTFRGLNLISELMFLERSTKKSRT